ncbi:PKD domain-containing protein [Aureibacter tunicatorum]
MQILTSAFIAFGNSGYGQNQTNHHYCGFSNDKLEHSAITNIAPSANELRRSKADEILTFPVVFHIIHENGLENITDDQCIEQVKQLNEDFQAYNDGFNDIINEFSSVKANVGLQFSLAKKDPQGNSTSGIVRHYVKGGSTQYNGEEDDMINSYGWPNDKYLNIYVVRQADYGNPGSPVGYGSGWASPVTGTTCSFWAIGRTRTASPTHPGLVTHELGHYYNLPHTFPTPGTCGDGDGIADTPPTDAASQSPLGRCDLTYAPCGTLTNAQNFMDYSECQVMFTEGQKSVIRQACANIYGSINSQENLITTGVIGEAVSAQFWSDLITLPKNNPVIFTDISETENEEITNYSWEFEGGSPSTHIGKTPPPITYQSNGKYNVKLTVTTASGETDFELKEDYIEITDDLVIRDGDFTVSQGTFWDPGFDGDYGVRTNQTMTLHPENSASKITMVFEDFNMEGGNCTNDYLTIFNGPTTNSPVIGTYCGTNSPGTIASTHSSGALTFKFSSNVEARYPGWKARFASINESLPPIPAFEISSTSICEGESIQINDKSLGQIDQWIWEFPEGSPASFTGATPPEISYAKEGIYDIHLTVSNENGSEKISLENAVQVGISASLPFAESFENNFPPANWKIVNPDNSITWEQRIGVGNNSSSCLIINNSDYNATGQKDDLIMESLDFSEHSEISMTFDVAYTKYNNNSPDQLAVLVSTNCGETWTNVYQKTHTELETVAIPTNSSNAWIPSQADHWRVEEINLSQFSGESDVMIKFENTTGFGTRIWLDNIKIKINDIVLGDRGQSNNIKIYPNPINNKQFNVDAPQSGNYALYSINGHIIEQGSLTKGKNILNTKVSSGIYIFESKINNQTTREKIIIL